jgi:hypothetical protein
MHRTAQRRLAFAVRQNAYEAACRIDLGPYSALADSERIVINVAAVYGACGADRPSSKPVQQMADRPNR